MCDGDGLWGAAAKVCPPDPSSSRLLLFACSLFERGCLPPGCLLGSPPSLLPCICNRNGLVSMATGLRFSRACDDAAADFGDPGSGSLDSCEDDGRDRPVQEDTIHAINKEESALGTPFAR